jgi:hypothetical protein
MRESARVHTLIMPPNCSRNSQSSLKFTLAKIEVIIFTHCMTIVQQAQN